MPLTVDRRRCLKSGQCTYNYPALFREGPDGYPEVLVTEPGPDQRGDAEEAVDLCPASAIELSAMPQTR